MQDEYKKTEQTAHCPTCGRIATGMKIVEVSDGKPLRFAPAGNLLFNCKVHQVANVDDGLGS